MIDWTQMQTRAEREHEAAVAAYENALTERRAAYVTESDPLRLEAEYDALSTGSAPDYSRWIAAVAAIKARIPLPQYLEHSN